MKNKGKRIVRNVFLSIAGLIIVTVLTAAVILSGRIATMLSLRHVGDDLYTMNYHKNYHLDKALSAGVRSGEDLLSFICDEMFFGYEVDANFSKYGCAAFLTETPEGNYLVGRNFDLQSTDTLCLYTHPKDGYASISSISTDMIMVGEGNDYATTSFYGRAALLAAPYMGVDGINEKGLVASLLDTDRHGETHMNTENPDINVTMAIRLLLDRAATVDEALSLLEQYDLNSEHGWTQHIFIADRSGSYAIAEFYKREMRVVRYPVCTNFNMSGQSMKGEFSGYCSRFDLVDNALNEKPENTAEEAMKLLEAIKQDGTEWSAVFDMTDFSADYAVNRDYGKIYHLEREDF